MVKAISGIAGLAAMLFASYAHPQQVTTLPSIAPTEVHIVNEANRSINFALRVKGGRWGTFELPSGVADSYECEGKCDESEFEFAMRTGDMKVQYNLESTKRYVIRWNRQRNIWDLYLADDPVRGR